ncbi:hypothetical protein U5U50_00815 [Mycoplasma sp. 888]|uniref:hypothetical protein n=1 Tax=Mycoplasma sp. 888 TaxID=3108483 RepID=UPI002D7748FD|nr:hypothetical protein [Mycoplasma sp. 888]WRQ25929.1 hypothetical protein U5U50_00815 [Mycoplasma sp. 888]
MIRKYHLNDKFLSEFLKLENDKYYSVSKIISAFSMQHSKSIDVLSRKVSWVFGKVSIELAEIKNVTLHEFLGIFLEVSSEVFRMDFKSYSHFESFIWNKLKLNTLNFFHSEINSQYIFDDGIANKRVNLQKILIDMENSVVDNSRSTKQLDYQINTQKIHSRNHFLNSSYKKKHSVMKTTDLNVGSSIDIDIICSNNLITTLI